MPTSGGGQCQLLGRHGDRSCTPGALISQQDYPKQMQVIGGDADKDVAVLQLDMPREKLDQLKPIALGTSTNLLVGQKVLKAVTTDGSVKVQTT